MKKIGIMQPYFLPYIGYFQLMNMVDEFVIYDNIKYSKGSWIRRNRMLQNGKDAYFTLPIKKASDSLDIDQRFLVDHFDREADKLIRKIEANYKKAPYFEDFFPVFEQIIYFENQNLFEYISHSIFQIKDYLEIKTPIKIFSKLDEEIHHLKAEEKVIKACKTLGATHYINSIGGLKLYSAENFKREEIQLSFFKTKKIEYSQFNNVFVPFLSILDVCMFNPVQQVQQYLKMYEIITPE